MSTASKGALFVLSEPTATTMGIVNEVYQDRINVTYWPDDAEDKEFTKDVEINSVLWKYFKFYNTAEEKSELAKRCIKHVKEFTIPKVKKELEFHYDDIKKLEVYVDGILTDEPGEKYFKPDFEDWVKKNLQKTKGLSEATREEMHNAYFNLKKQGYTVEQVSSGFMVQIGSYFGTPICVSFSWYIINDVWIGFYEVTSNVANHKMVETWIKKYIPHIPEKAKYDMMNIHNVLRGAGIERTIESIQNAMVHIENEHAYTKEQLENGLKVIKNKA